MNEQRESHELYNASVFLLAFLFFTLTCIYIVENNLTEGFNIRVKTALELIHDKTIGIFFLLRITYVFCAFSVFYLKRSVSLIKKEKSKKKRFLVGATIITFFLLGLGNSPFYNVYIFPVLLFLAIYGAYLLFSLLSKSFADENIFGVSNEKKRMFLHYNYKTNKGDLRVNSAEQHIYVGGGSGAGKSDSLLKPTIYQHIVDFDCPALIYDFKGDIMTLGRTAYNAFLHRTLLNKKTKTELKFLNFGDITRTFRINFLSPKYIKNNKDAIRVVTTLLKNINEDFRKKEDVWFRGAKAIWVSLIMRFINDDSLKHKLSFPVLAELLMTSDANALINFIKDEPGALKILSPVISAQGGATKQFIGYLTSANDFVGSFIDKELYWILSADQIELDINNPETPTVLVVAGSGKGVDDNISLLAVVITIVMEYFGEQNKLPVLFQLDEIYTIFLETLPKLANTFRSNGVCMQIGNQLNSMLVDMYGKEKANNILGACGNQFLGMANDNETSEQVVKMLSEIKKYDQSLTTSDATQSVGESLKNNKVMQVRDVQGMETGEFVGKIANGKPPFFHLQFDRYEFWNDEVEVPPFVLDEYSEEELKDAIDLNFTEICNFAGSIIERYHEEETEE